MQSVRLTERCGRNSRVAQQRGGSRCSSTGVELRAPVADIPLKFSHSPVGIRTSPPTLGADTDSVLAELGYDSAAIAALRTAQVV